MPWGGCAISSANLGVFQRSESLAQGLTWRRLMGHQSLSPCASAGDFAFMIGELQTILCLMPGLAHIHSQHICHFSSSSTHWAHDWISYHVRGILTAEWHASLCAGRSTDR